MQDDGNLVTYYNRKAIWSIGESASSQGMAIVRAAASQAGVPYCEPGGGIHGSTPCGGMPATFDCTGLTMYAVYQVTGKVLSHNGEQAEEGGKDNPQRL